MPDSTPTPPAPQTPPAPSTSPAVSSTPPAPTPPIASSTPPAPTSPVPPTPRRLHLAAAIDVPGATRAADFLPLARFADEGLLDFLTLGDSFAAPGLDALSVLARLAPETRRVGLVPTVTTTHTEPFHVQAQLATLDWVSRGRAGWRPGVSTSENEARLFGRRAAVTAREAWREAGEVVEAARLLWDSWEDDAEIRDIPSGRFVDRDKLHYADYAGTTFSVRGPSIVPRPPQGHPVIVADADDPVRRAFAVRHADVLLVEASSREQAAAFSAEVRAEAARAGREPADLRVLASLTVELSGGEQAAEPGHGGGGPRPTAHGPHYRGGPVDLAELIGDWYAAGAVDGFHLRPAEPGRDLERLVNGTAALLQHRGVFRAFHPGSTLREHLGLARPANLHLTA
ncbi:MULTISPECIES: LLM class flavin-dependent oxidoreductase [unclassified Streptomyces]|uniref:LLM class flavin-dependent oxidoreductase n=1 Tax=unclassified Streptomyces TaxID=2593676 RepID=UPI0002000D24|nr:MULTISPECIES: LLM class flavin-dependent oxidoreductase [unclassified Streptomyces]SCE57464.1 Flavin-dependent oxidoreductase, luciferase family (includes alkanesulfonate monooxygenase SsuD and methylene tetrahydromethanopterin reductase) [Streptomyces sp. DfronAA-171]